MTTGQRGFRGGRWEGRDIKVRGSPDCHVVGGTCLPIENWQYKSASAIEDALKQFDDRENDRGRGVAKRSLF